MVDKQRGRDDNLVDALDVRDASFGRSTCFTKTKIKDVWRVVYHFFANFESCKPNPFVSRGADPPN